MRLRLHSGALEDLRDAATWYEERQKGLGLAFTDHVHQSLALLLRTPEVWPVWQGSRGGRWPIKCLLLPRFPYGIAYQVVGDSVVVLAIAAHKKRPRYWSARTQR